MAVGQTFLVLFFDIESVGAVDVVGAVGVDFVCTLRHGMAGPPQKCVKKNFLFSDEVIVVLLYVLITRVTGEKLPGYQTIR